MPIAVIVGYGRIFEGPGGEVVKKSWTNITPWAELGVQKDG